MTLLKHTTLGIILFFSSLILLSGIHAQENVLATQELYKASGESAFTKFTLKKPTTVSLSLSIGTYSHVRAEIIDSTCKQYGSISDYLPCSNLCTSIFLPAGAYRLKLTCIQGASNPARLPNLCCSATGKVSTSS